MTRLNKLLLAVVVCAVLVVTAAMSAAAYTTRSSFCVTCHEMQVYYDSWQHSDHVGAECVDCHIPKGTLNYIKTKAFAFREVYVHVRGRVTPPLAVTRDIPSSSCTECHADLPSPPARDAAFDHGRHDQPCSECHIRFVHRTLTRPTYADPATMDACFVCHDGFKADGSCSYCHRAPHAEMGDCDACHGLDDWSPRDFEHPFVLEGAHAELECRQCHERSTGAGGSGTFGGAPASCSGCHADPHGGLEDCARCHSPLGWLPADFSHPSVGEHIPGGEHRLACSQCHPSGFGSASCDPCHDGGAGEGGD